MPFSSIPSTSRFTTVEDAFDKQDLSLMSQPSAIPKSMRGIASEGGVGPARALKLVSIKTPRPKSGEVLIRVAAAGNNYPDILQREGRYPLPPGTPATLGLEISGTVAVVGADVQRFQAGDKVCALLLGGGYATKPIRSYSNATEQP